MRKTRVLALVVASLVSTASFVGAQAATTAPQAGRHGMGRGMEGRRGGERGGALRGLKLSDAEKANVKAVHTKYEQQFKTLRESMKPVFEEARTLRQKGDTAGLRALWLRNGASRDQMQALEVRQRADIRAALSADNQKQFDANVAEQAKRRAEREKNGKGSKGERGEFRERGQGKVG